MRCWLILATPIVMAIAAGCTGPRITTQTLLVEMTDLQALAEYPDPPFICRQFSSYDRKSATPEDQTTEGWFANYDRGQYLRVEERGERQEHVMMDADGPGAIVRIWSANPAGTLRIYLDHADVPVIEAPLTDVLGGDFTGIPRPIAGERSRGWNCYLPIPYARHCKITSDAGDFYYHVNYRTYAPGTRVVTFTADELERLGQRIEATAALLAAPRAAGVEPAGLLADQAWTRTKALPPGATMNWEYQGQGPGALVGLRMRVAAEDVDLALRALLLTMTFDGEETVVCPLGDFFGAAPGVCAYASLPLGMTAAGELWSHWVMPFAESALITIRNAGHQTVQLDFLAAGRDHEWTDSSMHFHAKWRGEFGVPTRPMQDWNYLNASGQGVFVGAAFAIANPVKTWWGEGDEKIYVDGESFPSHFGTGTEDYYGYAWCCNEPFTHAYHNQPRCDGPGNYGHTAVNRWHIIDCIPFTQSIRFDMELWHWVADTTADLSVVAYWYACPGGSDCFPPLEADALKLRRLPAYVPHRVEGAIEGEQMAVLQKSGTTAIQAIDRLSNEQHLWWTEGRPGDRLELGFDVAQAGTYRVFAQFVKARDYAIVKVALADRPPAEPIDLYHDGVIPSGEIELGQFALAAGQNRIAIEITGANEAAVKSYMCGLDYLRLEDPE